MRSLIETNKSYDNVNFVMFGINFKLKFWKP